MNHIPQVAGNPYGYGSLHGAFSTGPYGSTDVGFSHGNPGSMGLADSLQSVRTVSPGSPWYGNGTGPDPRLSRN